ncbi:hypothetical protein FAP94_19745 [Morganella morganii]|nr:hypothetical protein [Morganella morganii]
MKIIGLLKLYLANSYRKKMSSWGRKAMLFVRMDLILSLSAIFSPIAILFSILTLDDPAYAAILIPFFGWCIASFLALKFSIYDDLEKINTSKAGMVNFLMFIIAVFSIFISCQLIIFYYPQN